MIESIAARPRWPSTTRTAGLDPGLFDGFVQAASHRDRATGPDHRRSLGRERSPPGIRPLRSPRSPSAQYGTCAWTRTVQGAAGSACLLPRLRQVGVREHILIRPEARPRELEVIQARFDSFSRSVRSSTPNEKLQSARVKASTLPPWLTSTAGWKASSSSWSSGSDAISTANEQRAAGGQGVDARGLSHETYEEHVRCQAPDARRPGVPFPDIRKGTWTSRSGWRWSRT